MNTNGTRTQLEEERRPHEGLITRLQEHAGDYRAHALGIPMSHELVWDARHAVAWHAAERLTLRNAQVEAVYAATHEHRRFVTADFKLPLSCVCAACDAVRAIEEAGSA